MRHYMCRVKNISNHFYLLLFLLLFGGEVLWGQPTLISPANNATCVPVSGFDVSWTPTGSGRYEVRIIKNGGDWNSPYYSYNGSGSNHNNISTPYKIPASANLQPNTTYKIRIYRWAWLFVWYEAANSSQDWSFTTAPTKPGNVSLATPANGATCI